MVDRINGPVLKTMDRRRRPETARFVTRVLKVEATTRAWYHNRRAVNNLPPVTEEGGTCQPIE